MLGLKPTLAGFTTFSAEGHGFGFAKATVSERVRGRVERGVLVAVLRRTDVDGLLERIRREAPIPHLTYWIEPVVEFGQLMRGAGIPARAQPTPLLPKNLGGVA